MKRTPSSGSSCNALMRHLHVHAMMTSKVVHLPRCLGTKLRREATSLGPKKKQRCSRLMGSLCLWLCFPLRIRDGCVKFEVVAFKSSLHYNGVREGSFGPRAISAKGFHESVAHAENETATLDPRYLSLAFVG